MKIIKWIGVSLALLFVVSAVVFFGFVPAIAEKGMNTVEPHAPYQVSTSARALHESLVIADLHADSTLWNRDLLKRSDYGHVDIPRMVAGNQAIQVFTTVTKTPAGMNYNHNSAEAR
ncbi:MAG: peptidase M19, partial [Reinekea sp.]|nr:peptidase M19 [Reinekea sp.]